MRTLAVLLLASLAGCADARPSIERYTYRIGTQDGGLCSATAVGREVLLTAKHCIEATDSVIYIGGKRVEIKHIETDSRDHALLWVGQRFPVWVQRGATPVKGDALSFVGNVDGFDQFYRSGQMAGWYSSAMLLDMTCGKGDSGAGVFNESGQLVGMISAVYVGPIVRFCVSYPLAFSPKQWARV
ncbi:trypsin-like peptidase domain-containing protein [Stenotrophomonas maltophilia]|uniref:trypsin-like peptidase domain-containing protein n=1 Tax=Stenotrophomonas maltophilia TaxID=40324 RepID=UPI0039C23B7C